MNDLKQQFLTWADGFPPITDEVYKFIEKEFTGLIYFSGLFLNLKPKYRVLSLMLFATFTWSFTLTMGLYGVTSVKLRKHDFSMAAVAVGLLLLNSFAMCLFLMYTWYRQEMINFFILMSVGCYNYGDDEEMPEIAEEVNKSRRQRIFARIVSTAAVMIGSAIFVGGRTIDSYAGITTNSTYVDDVYMLCPFPLWYPFDVTNDFQHYMVVCNQLLNTGLLAAFFAVATDFVVLSLQAIVVQLKILTFRIRKGDHVAYKQHLQRGGRKLTRTEMYHHTHFQECYNEYLNKCAAHHVAIIRGFHCMRKTFELSNYVGILVLTLTIGLALFSMVSGGRPSVLSLGFTVLAAQVIGVAAVCWQAQQILDMSELIARELFGTKWMLLDKKSCRTMMIMSERCKRPLYLDAAFTHTPLNWETFGSMLHSSYSYLNLLIAMKGTSVTP